jgi:hypothetical protein
MLVPLLLAVACLTVHQAYAKTQPKPIYQKEEGEGEAAERCAASFISPPRRCQMMRARRLPTQRNKSSPVATVPVFLLAPTPTPGNFSFDVEKLP